MDRLHGKPIDLSTLKHRVLAALEDQSQYWSTKAAILHGATEVTRSCPICAGDRLKEVVRIHAFPWQECAECSHVFNATPPMASQLAAFYEAADDTINHADDYTDPDTRAYRQAHVARPKVDFVTRYREPPGRWLDVGCGNGDLLAVAARRGYDAVGLEPNQASAEIARSVFDLEIHERFLDDYAAEATADFSVVSFVGLLDLVPDPAGMIRTASRLLQPGGVILASFPNYNSLSTAAQATYSDQVICRHMYPATLHAYTLSSAQKALSAGGLEPVATWFFGMDMYETLNDLALGAPGFAGSPLHAFLAEHMNDLQGAVDRLERCDKFHIVARRPE